MKEEIMLKDKQNIVNNILKNIKDFCYKNDITFYLVYGTALGAVRHKGFIPWDDDVDICMTRENYNKFSKIYNKSNSKYKLIDNNIDSDYISPLAKVYDADTVLIQYQVKEKMKIGLYVDIFVYDNIPDDLIRRKIFLKKLELYQKCWAFIYYKREYPEKSFAGICYKFFSKIFCAGSFVKKLNKLAQKYNKTKTNCFGTTSFCSNRMKEIFPKKWFEDGESIQFEGELYKIPKEYDKFLTLMYGDYMELPPIEKRISNHNTITYLKGE